VSRLGINGSLDGGLIFHRKDEPESEKVKLAEGIWVARRTSCGQRKGKVLVSFLEDRN